jgi:REP element-mobilizing transposase RayT
MNDTYQDLKRKKEAAETVLNSFVSASKKDLEEKIVEVLKVFSKNSGLGVKGISIKPNDIHLGMEYPEGYDVFVELLNEGK